MHKIRCPKRTNAVTMNSSGNICCTFVTKVVGSLGIPSVCLSILSQIRRFEWFVTCDSLWFVCICINRISGLVLSSWDLMISTWPRRDPSTDCHCATIWIGTALARCWQTWSQIQMNIKELLICSFQFWPTSAECYLICWILWHLWPNKWRWQFSMYVNIIKLYLWTDMIVIQTVTGVQYLRAVSPIESGHQAIWWVVFGWLLSLPAAIDAEFTLEALPHYHHLLTIRIHFPIIVSDSRRPSYHCQDSYFYYLVLIYARAQTITVSFTISEEHVNITKHSEAKYMIGEAHVNCKHKSTATVGE